MDEEDQNEAFKLDSVAKNLMEAFNATDGNENPFQTPVKPISRPSSATNTPTKGQNLGGGGVKVMLPVEGNRRALLESILTKKSNLNSISNNRDHDEDNLREEINKVIETAKGLTGPQLRNYGRFVKMVVNYCEGSPQKIDPEEYKPYDVITETLLSTIENEQDIEKQKRKKEQRLRVFKEEFKQVTPKLQAYKINHEENLKQNAELEIKQKEKAEAALAAEKETAKQEMLQKISFIDVKDLAQKNLEKTNQIIQECPEAKIWNINDFVSLLDKINILKGQIEGQAIFTLPDEFKLVVSLIDKVNDGYCKIYRAKPRDYVKDSALKALTFIHVEDEAFKPMGIARHNTLQIVQKEFKGIQELDNFKNLIDEAKQDIQAGKEINKARFDKFVSVVTDLNEGKYLPKRTNSLIFEKPI